MKQTTHFEVPPLKETPGWWLSPTPLKNHGVKVSWDDDIPNIWKVIIQSCSKPPTGSTMANHPSQIHRVLRFTVELQTLLMAANGHDFLPDDGLRPKWEVS